MPSNEDGDPATDDPSSVLELCYLVVVVVVICWFQFCAYYLVTTMRDHSVLPPPQQAFSPGHPNGLEP